VTRGRLISLSSPLLSSPLLSSLHLARGGVRYMRTCIDWDREQLLKLLFKAGWL
jgi:hypothetical protein